MARSTAFHRASRPASTTRPTGATALAVLIRGIFVAGEKRAVPAQRTRLRAANVEPGSPVSKLLTSVTDDTRERWKICLAPARRRRLAPISSEEPARTLIGDLEGRTPAAQWTEHRRDRRAASQTGGTRRVCDVIEPQSLPALDHRSSRDSKRDLPAEVVKPRTNADLVDSRSSHGQPIDLASTAAHSGAARPASIAEHHRRRVTSVTSATRDAAVNHAQAEPGRAAFRMEGVRRNGSRSRRSGFSSVATTDRRVTRSCDE